MKNIIYTRHDGGVSVVHLVPSEMVSGETEAAFIERIRAKVVPLDATNVVVADASAIPTDFEFRDAWVAPGGVISVDLDKAKALQASRINAAKLVKARELVDMEMMGENVATDKAALQAINAATLVAGATSIDELKAVWPSVGLARP
tara:strand:+ start:89 stop:529 length:441 start_codon:yes stop_codon:yes gene_type:complete